MKIKKIKLLKLKIPFVKPFVVSFGTIHEREVLICKITDESGLEGYGEAPVLTLPLYNPEMPESVVALFKKAISPTLKGVEIYHPSEVVEKLSFLKGNEFAKSAVEMAYYDLFGKIQNKRLIDLIGGKKKRLLISATLSIHPNVKDTLTEAQGYVDQGITYLKLKIKPGFELEQTKQLLKKFPNIKLMLDANSSYVLNNKTISIFKKLNNFDLYCIEQPLQSFDIIDHAKLQKITKTSIALDESIESVYDTEKALEIGSCKLVNIKIPRVGGITSALTINKLCRKKGVKTWVGGMLESPIGFYANLALSTVDNFDYPIDFLGALSYMQNYTDLFKIEPFKIEGNYLYPQITQSGLGMELNWNKIKQHIQEEIII